MNILIGTFRYLSLTGTETFTYTLLKSLSSQKGIKVFFYSPFIGSLLKKKSKNLNIFLTDNLNDYKNEKIDVIHSQHNLISIMLRYHFPKTPMIYLMHGRIEFLDQPPDFLDHNLYGGISHETQDVLKSLKINPKKIFYFPNSVDTERFSPSEPLPLWPKNLLILSNYIHKSAKKTVKKVASKMNLKVSFVGKNKQRFGVEKEIKKADIVMSLGRGIIEAMSCGKAALSFAYDDLHKYGDGMVTKHNVNEISKNNFSGRSKKIPFTAENLSKELKKYHPKMDDFNRQYVLKHFDINQNVKNLITTYQKISQERAFSYDKKQVSFIAQGMQRVLDYEKLALRFKDPKKLLLKRFKDQVISR